MKHEFLKKSEHHRFSECLNCGYCALVDQDLYFDDDEHPECDIIQVSEVMES